MTDSVNINHKLVALKVTTLQVPIVLNVMLQNIGMQLLKDVLYVKLVILGVKLFINAHAANYQDKSLELIVFVHHQKLTGMMPQKHAHVQQIPMVIIVFHAQLQEFGILELILVTVHHQLMYGMELNVFAQLEDTDHHVLNAQLQDIGMFKLTNVVVQNHSFGTETSVFVQAHTFYIKIDVQNAPMDILGKTINARLVHAPSKIWKS